MSAFRILILSVFVIGASLFTQAQTYYVVEGATGSGTSWADASGDLQSILTTATAGAQIWVAAGTYYPVSCSPCNENQRDISFIVPDSVKVYGGFNGTESNIDQRDLENNVSILSGDIDQDDLPDNNSRTIVFFDRVTNETLLDGFTFIRGNAHNPNGSSAERENSGGAIFNQGGLDGSNSHPVIRHCIFVDNTASGFGGAIYSTGGFSGNASLTFDKCTFNNNSALLGGGAIYSYASFSGQSALQFSDCDFSNNSVSFNGGAAVFNQGSENGNAPSTFNNCVFDGNNTNDYGGAVHSHGREGKSNATFEDCTFLNNEANFGGAVSSNGTLNGTSNALFLTCFFENNHAFADGGAIYNWGSDNGQSNATLTDCLLKDNRSDFAGAGIFNNGINGESSVTTTNCKFISNAATTYGGAIYNNGKKGLANARITNCLFQRNTGSSAGAIYSLGSEDGDSSPKITNCTFYGNTANVGGAVYSNASDSSGHSNPLITNCIFWENKANFGNVFRNILSRPFIQYSVVDEENCFDLNSGMGSDVSCGEGILFNVYPDFVDTMLNDFRLSENSPLIDIGNNEAIDTTGIDTDLDHHTRIFNDIVDLGAFEYFDDYISPTVESHPESGTLCEGEPLMFNITVTGSTPLAYQWYKDNIAIIGANEPALEITETLADDSGNYYCLIAGTMADTVSTDTAQIQIDPLLVPSVLIEASELEICEGSPAEFSLDSENEGSNPTIFWYLNDGLIYENLETIQIDNLSDQDKVSVVMISSINCAEPATASDSLIIAVAPLLTAIVEIQGPDSLVCLGEQIVLTADIENGGTNPQFQWLVNNVTTGQITDVFMSSDLSDGDQIICVLNASETCLVANPVQSESFQIMADSCNLTGLDLIIRDEQIRISPNPSSGIFNLDFHGLKGEYTIEVIDWTGKLVLARPLYVSEAFDNTLISIKKPGVYILKISSRGQFNIQKIIVFDK